jgi:hypothetical protein
MQKIDIDEVTTSDRGYCISYPLEDDLLLSSIMRSGILMPIALFSEQRPVIVAGFKRVWAARMLGIRQMPAVFLDVDEKQALLAAIMDNVGRPLNTIEKIRCVERMTAYAFTASEILDMMKLIGLPARERTLETASAAMAMDDSAKALIVRHGLPITAIEQLLWFGVEDRDRLMEMVAPLDITVSSFREVMQLAMLLKVRSGKIDFGRLSEANNMAGLRQKLKQMSHPLLTEMEGRLSLLLKSCALPPNIRVQVDPYFEKDWIDVSVRARNQGEIGDAVRKLEYLLDEGILGSLFELTHGLSNRN